jgi:hypothetical protein
MKTNRFLVNLTFLIALLLAACGAKETTPLAVPAGAQAGELVGLKDCEFPSEGSKLKYAAECGTLVVPENWDKADSRLIALPVVRIPATGANPAEPIFALGGGPGDRTLSGRRPIGCSRIMMWWA